MREGRENLHNPPAMKNDEIRPALQRVFAEVFEGEAFEFSDTLSREDLKAWDSLGHIRLVSALEEAFDVRLSLAEIESLTSTARILECLQAHS
jgi:acyl carrier protein